MSAVTDVPPDGSPRGARDNHFNLVRIAAATGVLVSHAFPVSLGLAATEPLERTLGLTLGELCVAIFFAVSGYLVTGSFLRSRSVARFWAARALRILPGLAVMLLLTVGLGGLASAAEPGVYWRSAAVYVVRNLTIFEPLYPLPGLFEASLYTTAVNASLWTLRHEVICYAGLAVFGAAGFLASPVRALTGAAAWLALWLWSRGETVDPRLALLGELSLTFMVGVLVRVWQARLPPTGWVAAWLAGLAALLHGTALSREAVAVAAGYAAIWAAHLRVDPLLAYNRLGDYSYGIYIYAFPIQQTIAAAGVADPAANMALAFPAALLCGVVSWHVVERPALAILTSPASRSVAG